MLAAITLRNLALNGLAHCDVAIADGRITAIAPRLPRQGEDIDASGMTALPGLIDHHMHILATAAARASCDLAGLTDEQRVIARLRGFAAPLPMGAHVRAVGYDERAAGIPDARRLDQWLPHHRLRIQDRTGTFWLLNSAALDDLGPPPWPDCVECDTDGAPTGPIRRGDAWLRERLGHSPPDVAPLARELARYGVVGVTDAGPSNGPAEARHFAHIITTRSWPLRLHVMGNAALPQSRLYTRGPLKLHFDEAALPDLDDLAGRIKQARQQRRAVAAHCVTAAELLWFLAAIDQAGGARRGDRIEHGGVISAAMIAEIAEIGLAVVTNPGFIAARGDRYLSENPVADHADLYRARSLRAGGITIAAGSDAPYGPLDPWAAMRAARDRITGNGRILGRDEALTGRQALKLYLADFSLSARRVLQVGSPADICLIEGTEQEIINDLTAERVRMTLVGGTVVWP